ncbi:hypothetical protein BRM1_09380 [Brevibacterium sp. BRM-1]|uniref:DUF6578 domain-containing protein n=1 Tax=Brevibacterium sp. BRM-1 TaxID=2999062 RepID=UPI0022831179|nr:DUF6578 domain-containing protein [Brevibacterium sp. BRM-1]WAL39489.1 hypothetical protein BRM1_09380 [Brevibacterium sp. BRM-1]
MDIAVEIEGWAQACCGAEIRVDEFVAWELCALDPARRSAEGLRRFRQELHDQFPDGAEHRRVTGTVRAIQGVDQPVEPVPGFPDQWRAADAPPIVVDLDRITARESAHSGFRVRLEVGDDARLPGWSPRPAHRGGPAASAGSLPADHESPPSGRIRTGADPVLTALRGLAAEVEADFRSHAQVVSSLDGGACTIQPMRGERAAVHWRSDGTALHVTVASADWELPAAAESVGTLRRLVAAAAEGRVHEHVSEQSDAVVTTTVVELPEGPWRHEDISAVFRPRGGEWSAIAGPAAERLARGDIDYLPWDAP